MGFYTLNIQWPTTTTIAAVVQVNAPEALPWLRDALVVALTLVLTLLGLLLLRIRRSLLIERQLALKNSALEAAHAEKNLQMGLRVQEAEQLKQLNREKDEFLGIAAHDLKNPIAAIRIFASLLMDDTTHTNPEQVKEYGRKIHQGADQMLAIVTNLLDINLIESGQLKLHPVSADPVPVAATVVESYQGQAASKAIHLQLVYQEPIPFVYVDVAIFRQVLDNMVSNAIKFSPAGKQVVVRLEEASGAMRLSVQDEGPGLSEQDQAQLFGKFVRLTPRPTGGESSTGLGLSIVKRLVELLGGNVWVESALGRGTIFFVALPEAALELDD